MSNQSNLASSTSAEPDKEHDVSIDTGFVKFIAQCVDTKKTGRYYAFKKICYAEFCGLNKNDGESRRFLDPWKTKNWARGDTKPPKLEYLPSSKNVRSGEDAAVPMQLRKNKCVHKFVNEDQLFVNIYTKEVKSVEKGYPFLKPVLVFIPTTQTYIHPDQTKTQFYTPEYFMREDDDEDGVVVVVVSYRSGILGFLNTNSPKHGPIGNGGLKDIALALEWVQDHIHYFQGARNNVTLCGQGFGAAMVHLCLLNQKTHHLYHRVIMQSGCALNPWVFNQDKRNERMIEEFLKKHTFEELQTMELEDLLESVQNHTQLPFINNSTLPLFGPVIEEPHGNAFLTAHPMEIMESENFTFKHTVIIGYNNLEGIPLVTAEMMSPAENHMINFTGRDGNPQQITFECFMKHYGVSPEYRQMAIEPDKTREWVDFITDAFYLRGIRATALKLSKKNENVYFYKFSRDSERNVVKKLYPKWSDLAGAVHGDELGYLFKLPDTEPPKENCPPLPTIMKTWLTFIRHGIPDPETDSQLGWPCYYEEEKESCLVFEQNYEKKNEVESKIKVIYKPEKRRMDYWDETVTENCLSHLTIPDFL